VTLKLIHVSYNGRVFLISRKLARYTSYIKINSVFIKIIRKTILNIGVRELNHVSGQGKKQGFRWSLKSSPVDHQNNRK
jgi:hypothetical protein